ncbi:MAG: hydrogenase expression/formation protein [Deltaproteobacteria bacterium CG03_land_8_20_14_0_80_45_14]|nr:MAG: hydrogenase expression/formation protein [Deltaproteobacteria bacterium CG03_land_8_20_14_0_80_45_14]
MGGRTLKQKTKILKTGKLDIDILKKFLERNVILDPQVVIGPKIGEDAAVIDLGKGTNHYWVVTSDPITFTTEEIGYYGVVVNLNDIATMGAIPKWFLATLLFPEGSESRIIEKVFRQVHNACQQFKISWIGGHTEITPGIEKMILSGHMIGEVKKNKLVTTSGARAGDLLLLVKGVCIEGTSIMAREKEAELLKRGISSSLIRKAKKFIFDPGIEVLRAARIACEVGSVHSMHDPTEGGLINGMIEMAWASEKEIEVDLEKVLVYKESRILCQEFGLNPLGVIASGALLLTVSPSDLSPIQKAFRKNSIPFQVIGKVKKGPARVLKSDQKGRKELKPFPRDEILKIY